MNEQSDTTLALLAVTTASGKPFSELVRRHRPGLLAFLYRMAGDDVDIEDLTQITFLKAYTKLAQFRSDASFKTWLFRIGYNEFLQIKRQKKSLERLKADFEDTGLYLEALSVDTSLDLRRSLKKLSVEERAALLLCDAVGLTNKEAADTMGAPLGSVKTFLKRARLKMRTYMEKEDLND